MAIIRKWQTLVEQGKFRQKWRVCQKFINDKKGHLDKWRFYENYKFGKNL